MLKIISLINLVLGFACMGIFAVWTHGDLLSLGTQAIILLVVAAITLFVGAWGLGHVSLAFWGLGAGCFMSWAVAASTIDADSSSISEPLKNLFTNITDSLTAVIAGVILVSVGTLMEAKKGKRQKSPPPAPEEAAAKISRKKNKPVPRPITRTDEPESAPPENDTPPEKKIVVCTHCSKKMRVKASLKKFRCPGCQNVVEA